MRLFCQTPFLSGRKASLCFPVCTSGCSTLSVWLFPWVLHVLFDHIPGYTHALHMTVPLVICTPVYNCFLGCRYSLCVAICLGVHVLCCAVLCGCSPGYRHCLDVIASLDMGTLYNCFLSMHILCATVASPSLHYEF